MCTVHQYIPWHNLVFRLMLTQTPYTEASHFVHSPPIHSMTQPGIPIDANTDSLYRGFPFCAQSTNTFYIRAKGKDGDSDFSWPQRVNITLDILRWNWIDQVSKNEIILIYITQEFCAGFWFSGRQINKIKINKILTPWQVHYIGMEWLAESSQVGNWGKNDLGCDWWGGGWSEILILDSS